LSTYADTSFLVSLYVFDRNSARASAYLRKVSRPILLTPLLETEIANAFFLRLFRKESTEEQIRISSELFRKDMRDGTFEMRPLSSEVFQHARQIAERSTPGLGTRTLDLIHVASAIVFRAEAFLTFDKRQARLARAEGLAVREI
jgi:predicted nucleic acid-binding protein